MSHQYFLLSRSNLHTAILIWIVISILTLGLIQPGYDHFRDTVSILAAGKYGWIQSINFLLCMVMLWSLANQYPTQTQHSVFVKRALFLSGIAIGLLSLFPAQLADASVRNFHGWSNLQSFMHFFLVTSVAAILLPIFVTQFIRDTALQITWRKFHRLLRLSAVMSCAAIPAWLWLRISGIGYEYKGLIEKTALSFVLYLLWQFENHLPKHIINNKKAESIDSAY